MLICCVFSGIVMMLGVLNATVMLSTKEPSYSFSLFNTMMENKKEPVYIFPTRLGPYMQESLAMKVLPVSMIEKTKGMILDVSPGSWPRSPQDAWVLNQFPKYPDEEKNGITRVAWENESGMHLFRVSESGGEHLTTFLSKSPWPPIGPWDGSAVASLAAPYNQRLMDGWSGPEFDGWCSRWSSHDEMTLFFDRPLEKGTYRLHLAGYRNEFPWETTTLTLEIPGAFQAEVVIQPGGFCVQETVTVDQRIEAPQLQLTHPTWIPALYMKDSTDNRRLGFYFQGSWFEAVDSK